MPLRLPAARDARQPRRLIDAAQHLHDALHRQPGEQPLVLAWPKVAFQDHIAICA